MSQILGLISTEQLNATRSENSRRKIFYSYPQGKFPIMGLLSLVEDAEEIADVEMGWWEERWQSHRTVTAQIAAGGPFADGALTEHVADITLAADAALVVYVTDATQFRERDIVRIWRAFDGAGTSKMDVQGVVTLVNTTGADYIKINVLHAVTSLSCDTDSNGLVISLVGTSAPEGDRSKTGGMVIPSRIANYTQIFRTAYTMTGSALKQGQRYDKTGVYKKKSKFNALRHMESMESAFLWGIRKSTAATTMDGEVTVRREWGGAEWFLKQYELGTTGNGGSFDYRPGGSNVTSSDWTTTEEKRIIDINGSTITKDQWNLIVQRAFLANSDTGWEKLLVCDAKFLQVIQDFVDQNGIRMYKLDEKSESYGMAIYRIDTVHGSLLIKGHPLFIENPAYAYSAFILDMGSINYHALEGRDTENLKNRQPRDADYRKDEYLTEATLEFQFPERHVFIRNCRGILS